MVMPALPSIHLAAGLSVLALSSRFDGRVRGGRGLLQSRVFQYSLCRVVLMVLTTTQVQALIEDSFSTRSVESF